MTRGKDITKRKHKIYTYTINEKGCWICTSHSKDKLGYIKINRQGYYVLHRLILAEKLGRELFTNMCACHTCDNPSCINPDHLEEHTKDWNNKDRTNKNRGRYNHKNFKAISPEGISYFSNNQSKFAIEHNLDSDCINKCLKNKNKTHKKWLFVYTD